MTGEVISHLTVSLDGFGAGRNQRLERPFGDELGEELHDWFLVEPEKHEAEIADMQDMGAVVMGRNMFSPGRGEWDPDWTGWWGDEPPYHCPVFVLTHHPREPVALTGTTFHFVTDGPEAALALGREAAGDRNVLVAGGATTINTCLDLGLIDRLTVHVTPILAGAGVRLFDGVRTDRTYEAVRRSGSSVVTHVTYRRKD